MGTSADSNSSVNQHVNSFVIPFVLISIIMLTSQILSLILTMNSALTNIHTQKVQMQTLNLKSSLREPMVDKQTSNIQQLITKVQSASDDIAYIVVEDATGTVIAGTDSKLTKESQPPDALVKLTEDSLIKTANGMESVGVVQQKNDIIGFVRLGISNEQLLDTIHQTELYTIMGGIGTLLIGALTYRLFVERILSSIWPRP